MAATQSSALQIIPQEVDLIEQITPAQLKVQIAREKELRALVISYVSEAMQEGHHFYYLSEKDRKDPSKKPGLGKPGALNLCSLFKVTPMLDEPVITQHADNHMTFRYRAVIHNSQGNVVAVGEGIASTLESKYNQQARWLPEFKFAEEGIDPASIREWDTRTKKNGTGTYRVGLVELPQNPADFYNTVAKMAQKRAVVEAALKLPLASELFTQDIDPEETATRKHVSHQDRGEDQRTIEQLASELVAHTSKVNGSYEVVGDGGEVFTVSKGTTGSVCTCGSEGAVFCCHRLAVSYWAKAQAAQAETPAPAATVDAEADVPEPFEQPPIDPQSPTKITRSQLISICGLTTKLETLGVATEDWRERMFNLIGVRSRKEIPHDDFKMLFDTFTQAVEEIERKRRKGAR